MNKDRQRVINYYQNLESRLGYTFLTWDTKHFGYYPSGKKDLSERKAQMLMVDLLAKKLKLQKTDKVLDAGCGRGTVACYLTKKYGAKVYGIDIVEFELIKARKRALKQKLNNSVSFSLQDYSQTNFPDNFFDKVFTLETLVHSPDFKITLKELHRVLKPGGKIAFFEYSVSPLKDFQPWEKRMIGIIASGSSMTSLLKMQHHTLVKDIEKAGFKLISDEDITLHTIPSMARFYKYAFIPYQIIKLLKIQRCFINTTAGVEFYKMGQKGLLKYRTITATKPLIP